MDIKSPKEKYETYTNKKIDLSLIEKSINLLKENRIDYEFRTTVAPGLEKEDIINIAQWIGPAKKYFLQEMNEQKAIIEPDILSLPVLKKEDLIKIIKLIKPKFEICQLR